MKIINSVQAHVAWQFSFDDASTARGVLGKDLVAHFISEYKLNADSQAVQQGPMLLLQGGTVSLPEGRTAIVQLTVAMQSGHIAVAAKTTDLAEEILVHIASKLDEHFGYKIMSSVREKHSQSAVTFEFSAPVEKKIRSFERLSQLLNKEIPRPSHLPFTFKQITFGAMDPSVAIPTAHASDLLKGDFTIERRANEPASANRFFSSAPVSTKEHERLLGLVEGVLSEG